VVGRQSRATIVAIVSSPRRRRPASANEGEALWHDASSLVSLVARFAAGLALVGLVAVASTSQSHGGGRLSSGWSGYGVLAVAGLVVLVVMVFWLALGGVAARVDMARSTRLMMLGTVVAALLAVGAVLFLPRSDQRPAAAHDPCRFAPSYYERHHIDFAKVCGLGGTSAGTEKSGGGGGARGESDVALALAAGASALMLLVAGTAALLALKRRRSRRVSPEADDAIVLQALDKSLDDLRRERDVRRAIVACYARMERAFAGAGRGRRPHETPLEFLRRVLERVAREPGQVLTELFERARFSVEPMGEREKLSAIGALEKLRARVAG